MWHLDSVSRLIRGGVTGGVARNLYCIGFGKTRFITGECKGVWAWPRERGKAKLASHGNRNKASNRNLLSNQKAAMRKPLATPAKSQLPTSINQTLEAIRQGRTDLIYHLRSQLRQQPKVWQHCGDLGRLTQVTWAQQIAGDDHLLRESIMLRVDQQREELAGPNPTAATRLMVERVVLSNLQLSYFEQLLAAKCKRVARESPR